MGFQIKERWQNFIDGDWVDGSTNETIPVINPATSEQISEIARATQEDVDRAVAAARAACARLASPLAPTHARSRSVRGART